MSLQGKSQRERVVEAYKANPDINASALGRLADVSASYAREVVRSIREAELAGQSADTVAALSRKPAGQRNPSGWEAGTEWDGESGVITTGPIAGREITDFDAILEDFGYDPAKVEIVGGVRHSRWQTYDGDWLTSYKINVAARTVSLEDQIDLPALFAASRKAPKPKLVSGNEERVTVVVYADPQWGKTGSRGGTPELLERSALCRAKLEDELKRRRPTATVLLDGGDGIENFHSGGNPMFTNDLSLPQQLDAYSTDLYEYINVMQRFGAVTVGVVPSNHSAWREGKQNLGKPSDDLGLYVHRQLAKLTDAAGIDANWVYPSDYDESMVINVLGTGLGITHGHQFGPGGAITWWQKQTFGAQAVVNADVLVTAHYHSFGCGVAGRNQQTGRQRWWLGAPTLDNGSDWYRNKAGRDSDAGLMIFDITPDGFDLGSLAILTA